MTPKCIQGSEGAGLVPWVGGPPDPSFGFYLKKHSKARPTQKYIIQRESLGTDTLQVLMNNNYTRYHTELNLWWLVSFHPVVGASIIP